MLTPPTQTDAPAGLHLETPAKVNLNLRVLGKRADGFHEIRSVALAVGLCDDLRLTPASAGRFELACDAPNLSCGQSNMVMRAARALASRTGAHAGARMKLTKRIPVAAGLGGGSSDAAATLWGLNRLWQTGLTDGELAGIGADLGSDVPLFFALPAARMAGRGERVERAALAWTGWALLVVGGWQVSTAEVYQAWKANDGGDPPPETDQIVQAGDARTIMAGSFNDLEVAVFRVCPEVRALHGQASGVVDRPVRVSGAGSTLFTLFDDREAAQTAQAELDRMGFRTALAIAGRTVIDTL